MVRQTLFCLLLLPAVFAIEVPGSQEYFELRVRPVLAKRCFGCHGSQRMGGLDLTNRQGMSSGGHSGNVIIAGNPESSLLVKAIRYTDSQLKMPPDGKLPDADISALEAWIKAGAEWPEKKK